MRIKNNQGSLFVVSLLLIVVFIALGVGLVGLSINEGLAVERQRRTYQAFHIAEAGMERAIYDLRQDFISDATTPSWADGNINGLAIGPDTANFYSIPYASTALGSGNYTVSLRNVAGSGEAVWIQSTGAVGDASQTIEVYAKIINISIWDHAIFAGAGAAGAMINGNVNIRGSVHILGDGLDSSDYAVDLGGTAELIANNYVGLDAALAAKVPVLPTMTFNGEVVSTLNAELRVKRGIVGLSGAASVGETDVSGNTIKETVDGSYVTDGFGGSQGTNNVHSDNGWSNGYDLDDTVVFPSLQDPYPGYSTYQSYLRDNALVISDSAQLNTLANITPNSSFSYSNANGAISMDGNGNLAVSGVVYMDGGNLGMRKEGSKKTITYTGSGSILATGDVQLNVHLVTSGNNSFPTNILGIMTPNQIDFNEANIDVMGLFYAEDRVIVQKQTDMMGTIVSNYFDMGTNVPSIFQVPETINHLPPGMIGAQPAWFLRVVMWKKQ